MFPKLKSEECYLGALESPCQFKILGLIWEGAEIAFIELRLDSFHRDLIKQVIFEWYPDNGL